MVGMDIEFADSFPWDYAFGAQTNCLSFGFS